MVNSGCTKAARIHEFVNMSSRVEWNAIHEIVNSSLHVHKFNGTQHNISRPALRASAAVSCQCGSVPLTLQQFTRRHRFTRAHCEMHSIKLIITAPRRLTPRCTARQHDIGNTSHRTDDTINISSVSQHNQLATTMTQTSDLCKTRLVSQDPG